jgi:hypothetical protein
MKGEYFLLFFFLSSSLPPFHFLISGGALYLSLRRVVMQELCALLLEFPLLLFLVSVVESSLLDSWLDAVLELNSGSRKQSTEELCVSVLLADTL